MLRKSIFAMSSAGILATLLISGSAANAQTANAKHSAPAPSVAAAASTSESPAPPAAAKSTPRPARGGDSASALAPAVPQFTTPGQAFFVSNGMLFVPSNVASIAPANNVLADDGVAVFGFVLPIAISVGHVSIQVSKAASATVNAGIYDASGNLLVDSGSFDTSTNSPQYKINTLPTAKPLSPGFYYFAYSISNTITTLGPHLATLAPDDGTSTAANAYSLSTGLAPARYGIAANLVTGGGTSASALPPTLGFITSNENIAIPIVVFEP